jgi:hypothetical protein
MVSSFPIGSRVILQNLVKGVQYNGQKGTVKSLPDKITLRQNVVLHDANKSMAVKPINLMYEPRELTALSIEEMISILVHTKKAKTQETTSILHLQVAGEIETATGVLRTMVRQRLGDCNLAQLLAEAKAAEDELYAKQSEAYKKGPSHKKEKLPPSDYLKGRYKQNAKRDAKEEMKESCNRCGKANVKLAKCGRCLSVFYCSKECQKIDHSTHKKECKNLLKKRVQATANDHDTIQGGENIPRIGVALSESITGVHGEVICHMPAWMVDELAGMTRNGWDLTPITRSVKYFFKVYQSSVEAAKSLSMDDVGGMCQDALILYWMKYPGVRRVYAQEATSGEFTLQFMTFKDKPDNWSIVGLEDRFAKIME